MKTPNFFNQMLRNVEPENAADTFDLETLKLINTKLGIETSEEDERDFLKMLAQEKETAILRFNNDNLEEDQINSYKLVNRRLGGRIAEFVFLIAAKKNISSNYPLHENEYNPPKSIRETDAFISSNYLNSNALINFIQNIAKKIEENDSPFYVVVAATINSLIIELANEELWPELDRFEKGGDLYRNFIKRLSNSKAINEIVEQVIIEK